MYKGTNHWLMLKRRDLGKQKRIIPPKVTFIFTENVDDIKMVFTLKKQVC